MNLWVFDLDGTLYDDTLAEKVWIETICGILSKTTGKDPQILIAERNPLRDKYKTRSSMIAYAMEYGWEMDYLVAATIKELDLEKCGIQENDQVLRDILTRLDGDRIVFTNNSIAHADRVLIRLGIKDLFVGIVGIENTKPHAKPELEAYQKIEELYPGYTHRFLVDDTEENLFPAKDRGWQPVWFVRTSEQRSSRFQTIISLAELLTRK